MYKIIITKWYILHSIIQTYKGFSYFAFDLFNARFPPTAQP